MTELVCDGRGWYKTYRQIDQWEWYKTPNMFHIFSHLLNKANFEDKRWEGIEVKRGQCITSVAHLSAETGISTRSVRTCLERLKSTNELTIKTTNKFSLITITKYDTYQSGDELNDKQNDKQSDKRATSKRQATDNNEELKKERSIISPPFFEEFWKAYPKRNGAKVGKKECLDFCKSFTNGDRELLIQATVNYAKSREAKEGFARDPIRFLKKDYWKDWIEVKANTQESRIL